MKKYKFTWFDNRYKISKTEFILAENMHEAWNIAKMITNFFNSSNFDIESLYEVSDYDIFYTMDKVRNMYRDANKEFILP